MVFQKVVLLIIFVHVITVVRATWNNWSQDEGLTCQNIDDSILDDLPNFDLIHRLKFDLENDFPNTQITKGSDSIQTAYRLGKNSHLSIASQDIFPYGIPEQFSFSCTFRLLEDVTSDWSFFRINDYYGNEQFGLTFVPENNQIELRFIEKNKDFNFLSEDDGYLSTENINMNLLKFDNASISKDKWNKIHLSFYPDNVTLFINCKKHSTVTIAPMEQVDLSGEILFAKLNKDLSTVPLDIQWMVLNCDASRPQRDQCNELSVNSFPIQSHALTKNELHHEFIIEKKCCQQSMSQMEQEIKAIVLTVLKENLAVLVEQFRGLPGKPGKPGKTIVGPPGRPGQKGDIGAPGERGFVGLPGPQGKIGIPGSKGDKGDVGQKGCKGDKGSRGRNGNPGKIGLKGPPGIGLPGSKGERGPIGNPGIPGIRGPQGPTGSPGQCEICNSFNMETLQLLLSQNQRQVKGPSK